MMSQTAFVVGNVLALVNAILIADIAMRGRGPWRYAMAVLSAYPCVVLAAVLLLGSIGQLSVASVTATLVGSAMVSGLVAWWRRSGPHTHQASLTKSPETGEGAERLREILAVAIFGGLAGAFASRACLAGTDFSRDALSYHAAAAAQWLVDGCISIVPFNYHAYYAYNAEVLSLWFMLPFRGDAMASLSSLYWATLAVAASMAILAERGARTSTVALCGALVLSVRVVMDSAASFSAVDLAGAALCLAAVFFAAPGARDNGGCLKGSDSVYSGLLAGFAAGVKVTFAPVVIILLLWLLFKRTPGVAPRTRARSLLVFTICAAAMGAYWYVRNLLLTGNPLFPAEAGPFSGPFTLECQNRTRLASWILSSPLDIHQWLFLVNKYAWWPYGLFLLAVLGYGALGYKLLHRRHEENFDKSSAAVLLLITGLVLLVLHPLMPFSATTNNPDHGLAPNLRYVLTPLLIGLVLFAHLLDDSASGRFFLSALAVLAIVASFAGTRAAEFSLVVAGAVASWLWIRPWPLLPKKCWRNGVLGGLFFTMMVFLALWFPFKQQRTDANIFEIEGRDRPIGAAWRALRELPDGARVATFGPFQYYPIYGRCLRLTPVPVEPDGSPFRPLHVRWSEAPQQTRWWPDRSKPQLTSLLSNLLNNKVEYVLVSRYNNYNWDYSITDEWPCQQEELVHSGQAEAVYNDGYSVIWKLKTAGKGFGHASNANSRPPAQSRD
jgi:hypothetical protein